MRPRKRKRAHFVVPLISMGDIAFLLIIFFILCSHFAKESGLKITPARSADIDSLAKPRRLVAIDGEGGVHFEGRAIGGADELEGLLGALIDEDAPAKLRHVHLKVDAAVRPEVYKPVLEALAKSGATIEFVGELGPRREDE